MSSQFTICAWQIERSEADWPRFHIMEIRAQCSSLGKIIISTVANWHEGSRQCASRNKMQIVLIPSAQCCVRAKGWTHNSGPNRSKDTNETNTHALQNHIKPQQKHYEIILSWCSWNSKPYELTLFWCSWSSKSHWFIAFWSSWNSEPYQFITCWSSWSSKPFQFITFGSSWRPKPS